MKIALIGTQSTGKSSILAGLNERFQKYVSQSLTRKMINENPGLPCNKDGDKWTQWKFFNLYYELFDEKIKLISDRSMIDVIAYTKWLCDHNKINKLEYYKMMDMFAGFTRRDPLTQYIYIPITFNIVGDGVRDEDEVYRRELDVNYKVILNELSELEWFHYTTLNSTSLKDRIKDVEDIICSQDHIII